MPFSDWEDSPEYHSALNSYYARRFEAGRLGEILPEPFEYSQEFRDARVAFKRRVNGNGTKADH